MKLRIFIRRLHELNTYYELFPADAEGKETASFSVDEIMDILYHSMPTT